MVLVVLFFSQGYSKPQVVGNSISFIQDSTGYQTILHFTIQLDPDKARSQYTRVTSWLNGKESFSVDPMNKKLSRVVVNWIQPGRYRDMEEAKDFYNRKSKDMIQELQRGLEKKVTILKTDRSYRIPKMDPEIEKLLVWY